MGWDAFCRDPQNLYQPPPCTPGGHCTTNPPIIQRHPSRGNPRFTRFRRKQRPPLVEVEVKKIETRISNSTEARPEIFSSPIHFPACAVASPTFTSYNPLPCGGGFGGWVVLGGRGKNKKEGGKLIRVIHHGNPRRKLSESIPRKKTLFPSPLAPEWVWPMLTGTPPPAVK